MEATVRMSGLAHKRTENYRKFTGFVFWVSLGPALASTVAVTQTATGIQFSTSTLSAPSPQMTITAGETLQVLQWLVAGFLTLFTLGISTIFGNQFH